MGESDESEDGNENQLRTETEPTMDGQEILAGEPADRGDEVDGWHLRAGDDNEE